MCERSTMSNQLSKVVLKSLLSRLYTNSWQKQEKNQERVKEQKSLKHKGTSEAPIYNYLLK